MGLLDHKLDRPALVQPWEYKMMQNCIKITCRNVNLLLAIYLSRHQNQKWWAAARYLSQGDCCRTRVLDQCTVLPLPPLLLKSRYLKDQCPGEKLSHNPHLQKDAELEGVEANTVPHKLILESGGLLNQLINIPCFPSCHCFWNLFV